MLTYIIDLELQLNSTESVIVMEGEQVQLSFYLSPVMNRTIGRDFTVMAETMSDTASKINLLYTTLIYY